MLQQLCLANGTVSFPKLFGGLDIPIKEVAFKLFGFEVRWYGVLISLGIVLCVTLALRACKSYGITADDLLDYLIAAIPSAVVGARLYYVIFNFEEYRGNPVSVFYYWEGGLAVYGGVIAALLAAFCVAKCKHQSFLKIADFAMPYIFLGQAIGRWGNFVNQEAFGGRTNLPWGMTGSEISAFTNAQGWGENALVHPTFFYESFWCLIGFILLLLFRRSRLKKTDGEVLCLYMILYGAERVLVEGLRTDSLYIGSTGIRVSQLLSGILIVLGFALFLDLRRRFHQRESEEGAADAETRTGFENVLEKLDAEESHDDGDPV